METKAKKYEIGYLVTGSVQEEDVVRVAGTITGALEKTGAAVRHIEEPKMRLLYYPINKSRSAYFGYTTFTAEPSAVSEITKQLKFEKEIIRFMIIEEQPEAPRKDAYRAAWQPVEDTPANAKVEAPRREPEVTPASAEEREAAIENIDKRLDEILGS